MARRAPDPSPALLAAIHAMQPVAPRRPVRDAAIVCVVSLAATAALVCLHGLALSPARRLPALIGLVALLALFVARVISATVPAPHAVLPAPRAARTKTLLAGVAIVAVMLAAAGDGAALATGSATLGWRCLARGAVAWLVPAIVAVALLRGLTDEPRVRRELAGAAAAITGLVLLFVCDRRDAAHLVLVHGSAVLLLPLAAAR